MRKIIFTVIALTLSLNATPEILNNTGLITELEEFAPACEYYTDTIKNSHKIKRLCEQYNKKLKNVLQLGYRMDEDIVPTTHKYRYQGKMHTCTNQAAEVEIVENEKVLGKMRTCHDGMLGETKHDDKMLDKYRSNALSLNKLREKIIEYIGKEKVKARTNYDVAYHEKLIRKNMIKLYNCDMIFISEHKEVYAKANNPRFMQMEEKKNKALLLEKQREHMTKERKKEENVQREESNYWIQKCGHTMTSERHHAKVGGKISGTVTGSSVDGYFVKSHDGTTFYIVGGPLHTDGEYVRDIFAISKGEKMSVTSTNKRSGVKSTGAALKVHYDAGCEMYNQ